MPLVTPEQIREAAKRRKTVDVEVEGIGTVRLRAMSAGDALRFRGEVAKCQAAGGDAEELAPALIARSWVGEDGELLLPEAEGIELARSLSPTDYNTLASKTLELNGLSSDPEAVVEQAVKNSEASRNESTPTGSPETSDTPTSI